MLIPDNIDNFDSVGEKLLYLKFKTDGSTKSFFVLHSLFTNFHLKNISGELDFLILAPGHGVFAIEVKHGKVFRVGGTWHFENKHGIVTKKNKSPFSQVDGTINSIRTFLLKKLENNKKEHERFSKILFGTGVAFTGMNEFVDFGTEGHSWQIFTRSSLNLPIGYYIDSLSKGWHNENKGKYLYDVNLSRPTTEDCKKIVQILRGDFDIDYSEINKINDNEQLIEEYTREQFSLLDFVNYNERCLIQGFAGTGKTIMALEVAHRNILLKKKVALFCFNNNLGVKLNESLQSLSGKKSEYFFAGTLHSFLAKGTELKYPHDEKDIYNFYNEALPFDFLIRNETIKEDEKYDFLIIDEAQDLITTNYLEVFDSILKGGIKSGNWVFLGDFSNQAIYLNEPIETMDLLNAKTNFTKFPTLKINCRNTQKIASQNTLLTGIEKAEFTSRSIEGDEIVNKFPVKNKQTECIEEIIEDLRVKGIPLNKISLLSPRRLENTFISDSTKITSWLSQGLIFSTIHSFKGLENTFIILFDFDEISSIESQRLLYIGISRAKQKLYLILNNVLEDDYKRLISKNINKFI
jgi:hypothetical protein